jgi:DNA-binding NarL/FixJ family response regulator
MIRRADRTFELPGPATLRPEQKPAQRRRPITVSLVDDEELIRIALCETLRAAGLELVGESATAEEAIELVLDLRPDVVLIDIRLSGTSGVQAIQRLGLLAPASRVLVLTRSEENRVVEAILAGASGYILKSAPPKAIVAAVKATAAGESVLAPQIAGKLVQRIREREIPLTANSQDAANAIRGALTGRELEIFGKLASGRNNHEIARELSLSANTVSNHIASILAKLHVENRVQAAVQAVRAGIS